MNTLPLKNDIAGEGHIIEELYKLYREPFVKWMVGKYAVSEADAVEIFQEAVIRFYENALADKIKEGASIKTYLFAIGRNVWRYQHRQQKKIADVDILNTELSEYTAEDFLPDEPTEDQEMVRSVMQQLGEPCKTILELYYYHDWALMDIAMQMGYKHTDVVKTQKGRCVRRLKKLIEEYQ